MQRVRTFSDPSEQETVQGQREKFKVESDAMRASLLALILGMESNDVVEAWYLDIMSHAFHKNGDFIYLEFWTNYLMTNENPKEKENEKKKKKEKRQKNI